MYTQEEYDNAKAQVVRQEAEIMTMQAAIDAIKIGLTEFENAPVVEEVPAEEDIDEEVQ
jgi:hypothetical protein